MTDYTSINEKFQKFIDENELGKMFRYTGEGDIWELQFGYPPTTFPIHNKSRTIKDLIYIAHECGRRKGNDEQLTRTVKRFENLISPNHHEQIWI